MVQHAFIGSLLTDIERQCEDARTLAAGLDPAQRAWAPALGAWSMSQCFDHLTVTAAAYRPKVELALESGRPPPPREHRAGFTGRMLLRYLDPSRPNKMRAPKVFEPAPAPPADALEKFLDSQAMLRGWIERAAGIDFNRAKVTSPASRLIRLRVGDALAILVVHVTRHLLQARRVREHAAFPR